MGHPIIITESEKKYINSLYGIITEQKSDFFSLETIFDIPGKNVSEINQLIKTNPVVRSESRLVTDQPNQLGYSRFIRIDNPQLRLMKTTPFGTACAKGQIDYDLTFFIKDNKVRVIMDNFKPTNLTTRIIPKTNALCPSGFNFGTITVSQPTSKLDKKNGRYQAWEIYIDLLESNLPLIFDDIVEGFSSQK